MLKWREIPGFEGLYEVSSDGQVKSIRRDSLVKPHVDKQGNKTYTLSVNYKRSLRVAHRLVAEAFIRPIKRGERVVPINGDKTDCRVANLKIETPEKSTPQEKRDFNNKKGRTRTKLSPDEVRDIRASYPQLNQVELARKYGVSNVTIHNIIKRNIWKDI